jgi:hypothetical protein
MTAARYFAYTAFSAYVAFGPGVYISGKTQVSGIGYVRYEHFPPNQSKPAYHLFRLSTEIDSGSTAAFLLLTNSL